jgi:hypothetical protein
MLVALAQADPTIADLPLAAHMAVALAMGAGVLLWLSGRTVFRPLLGAFGAVFGALIGFFLVPNLLPPVVFDIPSPFWGMGVGAALGLTAGIVLYRFAVATGMGLVFAVTALLTTGILINSTPVNDAASTARSVLPRPTALHQAEQLRDVPPADLPAAAAPLAAQVRSFLNDSASELAQAWNQIPRRDQVRLGVATCTGMIVGLLLGILAPRRSAAAASALLGSAIWLPSAVWLLHAMEAPWLGFLNLPILAWIVIWALCGVFGFIVQGAMKRPKPGAED